MNRFDQWSGGLAFSSGFFLHRLDGISQIGFFIREDAPLEVVRHLEQTLEDTLKDKACTALLAKIGQEPAFIGGEKFIMKMIEDEK